MPRNIADALARRQAHAQHRLRLDIVVVGQDRRDLSIEQEQRVSVSWVWPFVAMQAKTYSARASVG